MLTFLGILSIVLVLINLFFFYAICVLLHKLSLCEFAITRLANICEELFKNQQVCADSITTLQGGIQITTKTSGAIVEGLKMIIEQFGSKKIWTFMESKN